MPLIAVCDDCYYAHELGSTSGNGNNPLRVVPRFFMGKKKGSVDPGVGQSPAPPPTRQLSQLNVVKAGSRVVPAPVSAPDRAQQYRVDDDDEENEMWKRIAENVVKRGAPHLDPGPIVDYLVERKKNDGMFDGVLPEGLSGNEKNEKLRSKLYNKFEKELASSSSPFEPMYNWG